MTTIVYAYGEMAADSQSTWTHQNVYSHKTFYEKKIFKIGGAVVGTAGDNPIIEQYLEYLRGHIDASELKKRKGSDMTIILARKNGIFLIDEDYHVEKLNDRYIAVGSGAPVALGALAMGATARQALKIACRYDLYTGGKIVVYKTPNKFLPKKLVNRNIVY